MDIYKEWQAINERKESTESLNKELILEAIQSESLSALAKAKKGLKHKLRYVLGFIALDIIAMFYFRENLQLVILFLIMAIDYFIGGVLIYLKYKKIDDTDTGLDLLHHLKKNRDLINESIHIEMVYFCLTAPLLFIGAGIFWDVKAGFTIMESLNVVDNLRFILIIICVFSPLVYFGGHWLNKISFGKYLDDIAANINRLENIS